MPEPRDAGPRDAARPREPAPRDAGSARLAGVDVARGLAVFGMMTAHILLTTDEKLVDGRSSILFAVLAGVSIALVSGGATPPRDRRRRRGFRIGLVVRGAVILVLGLLLTALDPPVAVILDEYGVLFALLALLALLPRPVLAGLAIAAAIVGPLLVEQAFASLGGGVRGDDRLTLVGEWVLTGYYPLASWIAFPLAGLLAARSDLRSRRTRIVMIAGGAAAAVAGYAWPRIDPAVTAEAHSGSTAEILGSGGLAIALVAVLVTLLDGRGRVSALARRIAWPVASVGRMPLTIYTVHVLVMAAAGQFIADLWPRAYPDWLLPANLLGAVAIAVALRLAIGHGPLELLLRDLSRLAARLVSGSRHPRA